MFVENGLVSIFSGGVCMLHTQKHRVYGYDFVIRVLMPVRRLDPIQTGSADSELQARRFVTRRVNQRLGCRNLQRYVPMEVLEMIPRKQQRPMTIQLELNPAAPSSNAPSKEEQLELVLG